MTMVSYTEVDLLPGESVRAGANLITVLDVDNGWVMVRVDNEETGEYTIHQLFPVGDGPHDSDGFSRF
jgi:hypothetical protein